ISYLNQKEGHYLHSNLAVSSFTFPILLKLNYNRLHPFIGAQYQFIKSSREDWDHGGGLGGLNPDGTFSWTYQDKIYIKPGSSDYGWLVGIDVDITSRLGLRFSYYKGSKNIISYEITRGILNNEGGDYSEEGTRNEIMSLGLTYTPNWQLINQNRKSKNREKFSLKEWIKELY
ncbi:MAG: hypothetical protein PF541_09465, partial [Prolixibacteraceae bacterium]|nr:hypothetical protein [Prolixibacteraceae bacterium]